MEAFWMVLGSGLPTYRHPTAQSAKTEAERLARACKGQKFVVLQAIAEVVANDVVWDVAKTADDVPF